MKYAHIWFPAGVLLATALAFTSLPDDCEATMLGDVAVTKCGDR